MKVLALGQGKVRHAERYCGRLAPSIDCVTNEDDAIYRKYGLQERDFLEYIKNFFKETRDGLRAASRGHMQGVPTGNVSMMPGTFIVDTEGIIQAVHYNKSAGDHPDISQLLADALGAD